MERSSVSWVSPRSPVSRGTTGTVCALVSTLVGLTPGGSVVEVDGRWPRTVGRPHVVIGLSSERPIQEDWGEDTIHPGSPVTPHLTLCSGKEGSGGGPVTGVRYPSARIGLHSSHGPGGVTLVLPTDQRTYPFNLWD